jgi:hypothetical protein
MMNIHDANMKFNPLAVIAGKIGGESAQEKVAAVTTDAIKTIGGGAVSGAITGAVGSLVTGPGAVAAAPAAALAGAVAGASAGLVKFGEHEATKAVNWGV